MTVTAHAGDEILLGFTRALRSAGVPVTQDRATGFLEAVTLVGIADRRATYWAGRATLCSSPDDLERYDRVFGAWFNANSGLPRSRPVEVQSPTVVEIPVEETGTGSAEDPVLDPIRALASEIEVLRHRDVAGMSAAEKHRLTALFAQLQPRSPMRRTARRVARRRGQVDASRTLRRSLQRMGEPAEILRRARGVKPRRVVLLIDVSGSMSAYADALLRLAHRIASAGAGTAHRGDVEVFTLGTRLTRITRAMRMRDPERAIVAASDTVPDWSGGTRLGETLRSFLDRWGARGLARRAVVVVFSDGWERGETTELAEQMARLHRVAHLVVWVNPHRGKVGYQPVQQGIVAVLPFVDEFLAGHSLATFAELVDVIAKA